MAMGLPDGNKIGAIIQSMSTRIKICGLGGRTRSWLPNQLPSVMRAGAAVNCRAPVRARLENQRYPGAVKFITLRSRALVLRT